MNLCDDGHNEVCYHGRSCPVCDLREDMETSHQQRIEELESEIDTLKREASELRDEIRKLEAA